MFTFTALATNIVFSSILILFICFILKSNYLARTIGIEFCFAAIVLILIRLLLPFEFLHKNIPIKKGLPNIILFINKVVVQNGDIQISLQYILCFIWGTVAAIKVCRTLYYYCKFRYIINKYERVGHSNSSIHDALHHVLARQGKKLNIEVLQTDEIAIPFIFGLRNPKIVIPKLELTQQEWIYIFQHEIKHYTHKDLWIKIAFELLCNVYWWNPFVYILKKQLSKTLEIHNDLSIVKEMQKEDRIQYLECLLKVMKIKNILCLDKIALGFGARNNIVIKQRFYMVLDYKPRTIVTNIQTAFFAVIPLTVLVVLSFFIIFEPYSVDTYTETTTVEINEKNTYIIKREEVYDIYHDGKYFATIDEVDESLSNLPIYKNAEEVIK